MASIALISPTCPLRPGLHLRRALGPPSPPKWYQRYAWLWILGGLWTCIAILSPAVLGLRSKPVSVFQHVSAVTES